MLVTPFSKNCFVFAVLAASLISSRVAAQELSSPISPPLLITKIDSPSVGDISTLDFAVSLDLPTAIPVSGISSFSPWLRNSQLLARADLLYWRSLSLFRNQHFHLLNSQDSATNLLAESVSPVGVDLSVLSPIASDSLVAQAIAETEEVISDSVPVTEVSQANGANPEDAMPVVPTETPVPDSEIPASPATPLEQSSPESAEDIIQSIRNALVIQTSTGRTVTPGITVATPVGFGGFYGNVAIGGAYQAGYGGGNNDDASIATTVSLGNPKEFVSFDLTWNIYGLSDTYGSPNNFGASYLSLQISRLLANDWSVGLGAEGIIRFEARDASNANSYYLVTSKVFVLDEDISKLFSVLYTSIGLGTGRFLPVENFDEYGGTGVNVFGSAAIQVIEGVNAIVEWSGQDLNAGISIAPFPNFPLIITPAVVELTNNTGNGGGRFVISASLGLFF